MTTRIQRISAEVRVAEMEESVADVLEIEVEILEEPNGSWSVFIHHIGDLGVGMIADVNEPGLAQAKLAAWKQALPHLMKFPVYNG